MAKGRRGREMKSGVGAEFFKVIMPSTLTSQQLLIPPAFVKDFDRTMNEKVILKNVDGKTWSVDVKRTRHEVHLQNGWQAFADYHDLKVGEFLFFRYIGSHSFSVSIHGTNGCKKETFESKDRATHVKSEEKTDEETQTERTSRKRALPQEEDYVSGVDGRTDHPESSEERKVLGSYEQTGNQQIIPYLPSFTCHSRGPRNRILRMIWIPIPVEVMKEHNLQFEGDMILQNEKGKEWSVKIVKWNNQLMIGQGLHRFLVDNNVGPEQSCRFTFHSTKKMKVQIIT